MDRMSRSSSPSFDITESAYRPPPTSSTLFQHDADAPYATNRGTSPAYADHLQEPYDPAANDDEDSVELARLVPDKRITAHTRELDDHGEVPLAWRKASLKEILAASWTLEVVCCAFSLTLLAVIAVILAVFNGKPVPDWPFGITLGALVSVIATIMIFSLTAPVAIGLSQMKWLIYRSERPLADFGVVDEASRNAWGSLKLLAKRKAGFLAGFGAILMIFMLPIAPFVQQTIQYDTHLVNSTVATLPTAFRYHQGMDQGTFGNTNVDLSLKAAFMNGLLGYQAAPSTFAVPVSCTTGICAWLPYQSLAIASTCEDITPDLVNEQLSNETFPAGYHRISLPDGVGLDFDANLLGLPAMTIVPTESSDDLLVVFEAIAAPVSTTVDPTASDIGVDAQTDGPFAARCTLSTIVQSYTGTVTNGIFTENPSSAETLSPSTNPIHYNPTDATWTSATDPGTPLDASTAFGIDLDTFTALKAYLAAQFSGSFQTHDAANAIAEIPSDVLHATYTALASASPHTLDALAASIAASMTRNLRTTPGAGPALSGTAWAERSLVRVQWAWLALPAALVLLAGVFVGAVALASRRADGGEPWKASATATMFHGFDASRGEARRPMRVRDMDEAAGRLLVVLRRGDGRGDGQGDEGWSLQRVAA